MTPPNFIIRFTICLHLLMLCMVPYPASAAPVLTVEKNRFEVGALIEGDPVLLTIPYANSGTADLLIKKVKTDCVCTAVAMDKVLPPGGSGNIELAIDTAHHSGAIVRKIALHSNDPQRPVLHLQIAMEVATTISVRPDRIFLDGFTGETVQSNISFTANGELPLDLKMETVNLDDCVSLKLTTAKLGRSYHLSASYTAQAPGTIRGRLIFSTGYPMHPRITVPVLCRIRNRVETIPGSIDFGTLQRARYFRKSETDPTKRTGRPLPTRRCMLRINRGEELHLTEVKIPPDQFESRWDAVVPGSLYRIILTPRLAELPSGSLETVLTLTTGQNDPRRIKVPVSIHVK